jgi:hypothetical protein
LHANGEQLGDFFGDGKQAWHRLEGAPEVIRVQAGDDHSLACVSHAHANIDQALPKELPFINSHHFRARLNFLEDLRRRLHDLRRKLEPGMRDDVGLSVSLINDRFEYLDALPGDLGALQSPDQFFALP